MYRLILVLLFFYHASTPAAKSLAVDIQILKKQQEVREHVYFVFFFNSICHVGTWSRHNPNVSGRRVLMRTLCVSVFVNKYHTSYNLNPLCLANI